MDYKVITGDSLQVLKTLPEESIQCCVTSPPYWGLRDYGHSDQLGLESTPEEYVLKMVEIFREVRRVLRKDGTLWLNLGDSYSATRWTNKGGTGFQGEGSASNVQIEKDTKLPDKNLVGIPWRVAFALQADGWYLRQDIIWAKPNPMPESVTDRCTKAHEYIFLMTKSGKYYYDNEAVRERQSASGIARAAYSRSTNAKNVYGDGFTNCINPKTDEATRERERLGLGRNRRSVWTVTTKPYKDAHFATFPPDLIEPCILAGSKAGDVILDPFAGSGTTLAVATKHNRNSIGIELNPEYVKLIHKRVLAVPLSMDFDTL